MAVEYLGPLEEKPEEGIEYLGSLDKELDIAKAYPIVTWAKEESERQAQWISEGAKGTVKEIAKDTAKMFGPIARGEFDLPTALVETVKGLGLGMLGFADEQITRLSTELQMLAGRGEIDWAEVDKAGKIREQLYHFEPSDPLAAAAISFVAAIPLGIEKAAEVLSDQFDNVNVKAAIQTAGWFGSLGAFGKVFQTLKAPLKPKVKPKIPATAKEFEAFMREEAAIKLSRQEKAAVLRAVRKRTIPPEFMKELEKVEPLERPVVELAEGELGRPAYEGPARLRKAWRAVKAVEPKEVIYKPRRKKIAIEEKEAPPAVSKVEAVEPTHKLAPFTEKGFYDNFIVKDTAGTIYEGNVGEHSQLLRQFKLKPEDISKFGVVTETGRYKWERATPSRTKVWKEMLAKRERGEPEAMVETFGFQQMYEAVTTRVKKTKPVIPETDIKVFDKGEIVKQRTSKERALTFPPVYEAELKILKAVGEKDMPPALLKHGFQNPPRMFDQYFGEDFKSMTYWQVVEGKARADRGYKAFKKKVVELRKTVPLKSRRRLKIYEIAQQEGGMERLANQGIKKVPKLTAKEMKVYREGERIYEMFYDALNAARKSAGKETFGKVKNYGPFIHDLGLLEQMGFSPGLERLKVISEFIQMRGTPFRYAKPRAEFYAKKLELDYFNTMDQYGHSAINHIQMTPVISKLHEFTLTFGKKPKQPKPGEVLEMPTAQQWKMSEVAPAKAQWYRAWLDHVAGKPSMIDAAVGPFVNKSLGRLNKNATFAILGGNLRTILIQPSALMQTYVEIGPKYTMKGILSLIDPKRRNLAFEKSNHLLSREYDVAARDAFSAVKSGSIKDWAGQKAMKGVQITDMEAAMATWQGSYLRARSKELNYAERKAVRYADDITIRTQASAARQDISPIQRSKLGRTATLFQTFVINEWNFMMNDVFGYKNPKVKGYERFKRIRRFVIGCTLINMFYEDILGLPSPYPSPLGAFRKAVEQGKDLPSLALDVGKELIEKLPIISGARYGAIGPAWVSKTAKAIYTGRRGPEALATLMGLPGTSQLGKMLRAGKRGEMPLGVLLGRYTPVEEFKKLRQHYQTIK